MAKAEENHGLDYDVYLQKLGPSTMTDIVRISLVGIDIEACGVPRNDGTRGSSLYSVPLLLSAEPPKLWCKIFEENWHSLPRPKLCIDRNRLVFSRTTVKDVPGYIDSLKIEIEKTNFQYSETLETMRAQQIAKERIEKEAAERHTAELAEWAVKITQQINR